MKKYNKISDTLKTYLAAYKELQSLGVISNKKDFTGQIGEWFVSELYKGEKSQNGIQKDWDIKAGEKLIQVKTHSKAKTTGARFSKITLNSNAKVDELVIVIFDPDYRIIELYSIPWKEAVKLIKKEKHGDVLYWNHLKAFTVKLDRLKNQKLIKLFS